MSNEFTSDEYSVIIKCNDCKQLTNNKIKCPNCGNYFITEIYT
jgi:RNA polymerase subunit RPABC4/transcription elongation factor Spt4